MDVSSFVALDDDLIFVVDIFEILGLFADIFQHSFTLVVGEGVAIGKVDFCWFGKDEIEVQFRIILLGLSSIN